MMGTEEECCHEVMVVEVPTHFLREKVLWYGHRGVLEARVVDADGMSFGAALHDSLGEKFVFGCRECGIRLYVFELFDPVG